jgi:hypothetical protein
MQNIKLRSQISQVKKILFHAAAAWTMTSDDWMLLEYWKRKMVRKINVAWKKKKDIRKKKENAGYITSSRRCKVYTVAENKKVRTWWKGGQGKNEINTDSFNGRSKEKRKTAEKMDWRGWRGFDGNVNAKWAQSGQRTKGMLEDCTEGLISP